MTDLVWPNGVRVSQIDWRPISNSEMSEAPFSGGIQTASRPGDKIGCAIYVNNSTGSERAKLRAMIAALRGRANRIFLQDFSYRTRGTWPTVVGGELYTNSDFSNGTTGWSVGAGASLSVNDQVLRVSRINNAAAGTAYAFQTISSGTQFAPYILRMVCGTIYGTTNVRPAFGSGWIDLSGAGSANAGYQWRLGYYDTGGNAYLDNSGALVSIAGEYYEVPFGSLSKCFVADGGGNLLLRSDTPSNAAWTKTRCTSSAVAGTAPDGVGDADALIDDGTVTATHGISQSIARTSGVTDLCGYGYFKRRTGTRNVQIRIGNDGSNYGSAIFDLSNGTVVSGPTNTGTATKARAFVVDVGNSWYFCCVVARVTSAATVDMWAGLCSGTNASYSGDSSSSIYAWRMGANLSSFPTRGTETTTVGIAAAAQSSNTIYVKGLPASQAGLLLAGDCVEIDKQIKTLIAPLNSDAAGCGVLQLDSPCARDPSDNTPIMVEKPMAKFILVEDAEYPSRPGVRDSNISDFTLRFVQDLAA